ncbi:hypothetical protein L3i22_071180 [Actinoplanes sp. L3-i22]|nr:hypothetical protein L3i22_071180 [Actinoplanes sp. L3-i22]
MRDAGRARHIPDGDASAPGVGHPATVHSGPVPIPFFNGLAPRFPSGRSVPDSSLGDVDLLVLRGPDDLDADHAVFGASAGRVMPPVEGRRPGLVGAGLAETPAG